MAIYVCDNPPPPGNYGRFQVYVDRGRTIGRVPNPLEGVRVKNAPEFANTRKYADLLATASPLASAVHRTLPANRKRTHYQQLAGMAIQWLKEAKTVLEVQLLLQEAAELIRRELKRKRAQELVAERKKCRKAVVAIPTFFVPETGKSFKGKGAITVVSISVERSGIQRISRKKKKDRFLHRSSLLCTLFPISYKWA